MIYVNGINMVESPFPNGESHLSGKRILDNLSSYESMRIDFKYEDDGDLIKLCFIKNYLDSITDIPINLFIRYMPYSRMDRVESKENVFTLKSVCNLINSLNFTKVEICEPHSDVTKALLNNSESVNLSVNVAENAMLLIKFDKEKDVLLFPDAGAQKRYMKFFKDFKTVVQFKVRDFVTGKIVSSQVVGDIPKGSKVLIIDDLCSYGGTFVAAAEQIKDITSEIYLAVAHCEKNIKKGRLLLNDSPINKVFTTDSILNINDTQDNLIIFNNLYY